MKTRLSHLLTVTALAVLPVGTALAGQFVGPGISDPGFEQPPVSTLTNYSNNTTFGSSWTVTAGSFTLGTGSQFGGGSVAQEGSQLLAQNGAIGAGATFSGAISGLTQGTLYTLSYYVSSLSTGDLISFTSSYSPIVNRGNSGSYSVNAVAADGSDSFTATGANHFVFTNDRVTSGFGTSDNPWQQHSFNFTANDTSVTLGFTLTRLAAGNSGTGAQPGIDNISIAPAAVPEPSTWALLLGGAGAIGFISLRRRRSARA